VLCWDSKFERVADPQRRQRGEYCQMSDLTLPAGPEFWSCSVTQAEQATGSPEAEMRQPQDLGDHLGRSSLNFAKESDGFLDQPGAFTARPPPDCPTYRLKQQDMLT
jgi:hypothetical protein